MYKSLAHFRVFIFLVTVISFLLLASLLQIPKANAQTDNTIEVSGENKVYAGMYSNQWHAYDDFDALHDAAGGVRATFGGTFLDFNENGNVSDAPLDPAKWSNTRERLNNIWLGQTTPIANVNGTSSMRYYASGSFDTQMRFWAEHVKQYLDLGQGRSLLVAPFQEMNGDWVSYGCDPESYKTTYRKLVSIFRDDMGIDETQVRFMFAPNGWTTPGCGSLADYYPGSDVVDVIGFSGYNYGTCVPGSYRWQPVSEVVDPYIDILSSIDSTKPLMVLQTAATRPASICGGSQADWTHELFAHLALKDNVVGFVWFNYPGNPDYRIWDGKWVSQGWSSGSQLSTTQHVWPLTQWFQPGQLVLASASPPPPGTTPPPSSGVSPCVDDVVCDSVGFVDSNGRWWLYDSLNADSHVDSFFFGNPGDVAFMGDWNGDGVSTPGLYRQSDGFVYLKLANSQGNADVSFFFGNPGDVPLVGDFNGDGFDTVSIYRQTEGKVYIVNKLGVNGGSLGAAEYSFFFGNPGDQPFVGDFDGNEVDTVGLYRTSSGFAYFRNTNSQGVADYSFFYGNPGDVIVAGDWDGDGDDTVAVYRANDGMFYINLENKASAADYSFHVGTFQTAVQTSGT